MENDIERLVPGKHVHSLYIAHLSRYLFAIDYFQEKRVVVNKVLDAGCGSGYGSKELSKHFPKIIGIDVSEEAVNYSLRNYSDPKIEFRVMDLHNLDFIDASFDAVINFEVIEHLDRQEDVIRDFKRILKPGGYLIISTPYNHGNASKNPYHPNELNLDQFKELVLTSFKDVEIYSQKRRMTEVKQKTSAKAPLWIKRIVPRFVKNLFDRLMGVTPFEEMTVDDYIIDNNLETGIVLIGIARKL